ncbi:MAG: asparagine synthase (glutamine-hydrolyzing) [Ignavibacteriaceae bacterium]
MCGIFGIINKTSNPVDSEKLISARDTMTHRGPDDAGIYINKTGNVGFGHRRLSIIDLSSSGHQPMTTEDGRYTIVFNGEIYNYQSIKNSKFKIQNSLNPSLVTRHSSLNFRNDTEVLLNLYAQEGPACLNSLRGMFAFAIWDEVEQTLFAARDRFGIKPFYYYHQNGEFIFSSELKAIKQYKPELTTSNVSLDLFLRTGSIPSPYTLYNETYSLYPGSYLYLYLYLNLDFSLEKKQWWKFSDLVIGRERKKYDGDAREEIHEALIDSIKAHCVADVEVGAFLSGGMDSTAIVALMREISHEKIKTISVTFDEKELDESKYSQLASDTFNTNHYEYRLTEEDVITDLDNIFESMDQPTIDGVNTYFVSKAAKEFGLKVVMSGLGGDELFGGYPSFKNIPRISQLKKIPFSKELLKLASDVIPKLQHPKFKQFLEYYEKPWAEYSMIRGLFTEGELSKLAWNLSEEDKKKYIPVFEELVSHSYDEWILKQLTGIEKVSYLESLNYMSNQLLRDSDVYSMQHSLELRVPFVDDELYSTVLPYLNDKIAFSKQKYLMSDAVKTIPEEISNRKKMGFTFPFDYWMKKGKLLNALEERANKNSFLQSNGYKDLKKNYLAGKIHWSRIWAILILKMN